MRLARKFRHETAHGAVIEVDWTPDGLVVRLNGEEQDTSCSVEYVGPECSYWKKPEEKS